MDTSPTGSFSTVPITVGRRRGLRLEFRVNAQDRHPIRLNLVEDTVLGNSPTFPFSYEFVDTERGLAQPRLRVVAGPGVHVFFDTSVASTKSFWLPSIEIIRVQDVNLVPPIGMQTVSQQYLREFEYGESMPVLGGNTLYSESYVRVVQLPDGLVVYHPQSESRMSVSVKAHGESREDVVDAQQRFAFDYNPDGKVNSVDMPFFTLVKTPSVEVSLSEPRVSFTGPPKPPPPRWYAVYQVGTPDRVPSLGTVIRKEPDWVPAPIDPEPQGAELFATAGMDLVLSAIPVVGNMIDLAEFTYAAATGKNKWGRPTSRLDLFLMGLGAAFPFVVKGAARIPALMRKAFGDRALRMAKAFEELEKARPTANERKLIVEAAEAIQKGVAPTAEAIAAARALAARVERNIPAIENLLTADGKGFTNVTLQAAFVRYSKSEAKYAAEGPATWARLTRQPEAMRILEAELGQEFRTKKFLDARMFNPHATPIPVSLTPERLSGALADLDKETLQLFDRLSQYVINKDVDKLVLSRLIDGGSFRILKGNAAEILSRKIQLDILAKVAEENPGRVPILISGAKVQLAKDGKLAEAAKLFSDNLIAFETGKGLEIVGVVEVKSGFNGGLDATQQVFTWVEQRIEEGSRVILPAGSRVMTKSGTSAALTEAKVFSYGKSPGVKEFVYNLTSARRHLITAKGASHLGINSSEQLSRAAARYELPFTSQELDAIVARLLLR